MTTENMTRPAGPEVLWLPTDDDLRKARVTYFRRFVEEELGLAPGDGYEGLWRWSVEEPASFWDAVRAYFGVDLGEFGTVLSGRMPQARWFEGGRLNYAEQIFRNADPERPALVVHDESGQTREIGWDALASDVAGLATTMTDLGVVPGDRVAAYLTNRYEAVVGLLASAAIGAVWSVCAPDFGFGSAAARLTQIRPKVLIAADGYEFGGKSHARNEQVAELVEALGAEVSLILIGEDEGSAATTSWAAAVDRPGELSFAPVPFDHPLWILFSSGTTGAPKGIVQGHGGIVLEHMKTAAFELDLDAGDRFYFYSSTSWMVWNVLVGGLLVGAIPILYDGSPSYPDVFASWRVAAATRADVVGLGAAYVSACANIDSALFGEIDLDSVHTLVSTGSPLPDAAWRWLSENLPPRARIDSTSGGTDICSTMAGGSPLLPVYLGELSGPCLGVDLHAWNEEGEDVIGEVGELVVTSPLPSMPIEFWNDPDGSRYRDSYFSMYPGAWRHGDWIKLTERGTVVIEGRSDSTLNRGGVRMGSADIYTAVEGLADVADSLVIGVELSDGGYYMPLFLVPAPGASIEDVESEAKMAIRTRLSPRHVPDEIIEVDAIPRTLTGKKLEVPIKRMMMGVPMAETVDLEAVDNPDAVRWFAQFAARFRADSA